MRVVKGSLGGLAPLFGFAAASAAAFSAALEAVCATNVVMGCDVGLARARGTAMSLILALLWYNLYRAEGKPWATKKKDLTD